jgi:hypothetical protein
MSVGPRQFVDAVKGGVGVSCDQAGPHGRMAFRR